MNKSIQIQETTDSITTMQANRKQISRQIKALHDHKEWLEKTDERKYEISTMYVYDALIAAKDYFAPMHMDVKRYNTIIDPIAGELPTKYVVPDKYQLTFKPGKGLSTVIVAQFFNHSKDDLDKAIQAIGSSPSHYAGQCLKVEIIENFFGKQLAAKPIGLTDETLIYNPGIENYLKIVFESIRRKPTKLLLAGDYGTGKTALVPHFHRETKQTTIYATVLNQDVLDFAKMFEPSIIFVEDIEKIDESQIDLILDGVDTKQNKVSFIFTSNNPHLISQRLLRPGRIDFSLTIENPTAKTVERFLALHKVEDTDRQLSQALANQTPAIICEVCRRINVAKDIMPVDSSVALQFAKSTISEREFIKEDSQVVKRIGERVLEMYDIAQVKALEINPNGSK